MIKNRKLLNKLLVVSFAVGSFSFIPEIYICPQISSVAYASIKEYTGIGEYIMSNKETPDFAINNAKLYAERDALEQAGVYISSITEVKNNIVQKDEIVAFTAGIIKSRVIKTEPIPLTGEAKGWIKYRVTVSANIDENVLNSEVEKWRKQDEKSKSNLITQENGVQREVDKQKVEIKTLEKDLSNIKTKQDKENIKSKVAEIDKKALAIQKFKQARNIVYNSAKKIKLYTEAIELNPNFAEAYYRRGVEYIHKKYYDYNKNDDDYALSDFNKAIELNPNVDAGAYFYRGIIYGYFKFKNYDKSIENFTKAIELNPGYSLYYGSRASAYEGHKDYSKAIDDYTKYLEIDQDYNFHYFYYDTRARCYEKLGQYEKAIIDYTKSIELNKGYSPSYSGRGNCYKALRQYEKAIVDFTKSIELGLYCYSWRGDCYKALGQIEKANADYAKDKERGYTK